MLLQSGEYNTLVKYNNLVGIELPKNIKEPASIDDQVAGYNKFNKLIDA